MESDRKALRTSLTSEVLGKKEEVVTALLPHYEALIQRSCDRVARIPIDINWESFIKAKRPDLALSTLHLWGSYFVLHRIASVIEEICTSATPASPLSTSGHPASAPSVIPSSPSSTPPSASIPLYPGGKSIIASQLVRIIVQNEDKPLHGKDKVVLKPYLRKKHNNDKEKAENDEEVEDEEVWVLTLRGNFGQGALGGFSRKRLISTLTRRLKLTALHHKALLDHVILPRCNAQLLALAGGDSTNDSPKATDDEDDELVRGSGVVAVQVAIDWETIDECDDERALRNLAAWCGHYSLAQVALAFTELAERWKTAECVSAVVQRVVVRHVPGQDATRKRCFVEAGTLYIDGVWELDGWQAGFRHHQIAEVWLRVVLKQTHYLATCPHRGKKKFKYLKRALQSTNVLNGHVDYLKRILSQPCFQQPDQALTNAINTCLQPYVTKGEEYIHGWHCIKVNFRGQAQERIVVLTDCAVYTFAYDFAKNKIDNDRVHRHVHEHFKHITYGKYMNAAGGQAEYCLRYETHERVKKDKDAKSGGRSLGNVVAKAESAAALNQKVLGLVELMVDEQLNPNNEATPAAAAGDNSEAGLGREVDTGVKGFTCRRLLKLLGETILKYHDNYRLDLAHLLPGPAMGLIDGLGLLAAILEDHQHALVEGLVHAAGEPHLQGQVKLDNSPATTLHFVLKSLLAQLKALLVKRAAADGRERDETDSSEASLHNFTLAPPTPSSTSSSSSSAASSVHILFFVSQLLKQMQRLERIEQVELMGGMTASASKRRTSRENSHVDHDATSDTSTAPAKKTTTKRPRTANNRRMFHLPTPEPLPVSRVLQRIGEHLRGLALPPFRFPSSSVQLFASSSSTSSSSSSSSPSSSATSSSSPSPASSSSSSSSSSPPPTTSPVELADVSLSAEDLIEAVVKALIDKPIPAVEYRCWSDAWSRCCASTSPPFQHAAVDQLLGLAKPKPKANKPSSSPSSSSPFSTSAGSSSPSFFRKFIPEEPDTWVLLLKPAADIDDPDARQDLVKEMGWAIYGAARTALRPCPSDAA
ncbi:uncharacterized protein ACA1_054950 [Acanthamoeba castellanii str. Neff]|uniref:Inositol phosphatase domain-containing protein n=1 Tax=Acanthamoeba castellanii (strain ATCC 30010 / Neff) TaxID=1257118 RepID=L8H5G2_ACACF|nr:uncharacterized protein ACA1_054950 [Acanthamoeba castellanii str. Neff]ELR20749.1 hypothetical protein ACA1_054950 [Acanthamoeba castellanii str. Neff]